MPEQSIRFGITDRAGKRAATWKCWSPVGTGKQDVYLTCRELRGALKASLHQSGVWHVAYSNPFFEENIQDPKDKAKGRFIEKWRRPSEISRGVTLAYRIVTPWYSVVTPFEEDDFPKVRWIPIAAKGRAVEIDILFTDASTSVTDWPGKRSMNTRLVDSLLLDNGEKVWIVHSEQIIQNTRKAPAPSSFHVGRYFKGRSYEDLRDRTNLRMIVFGNAKDESRVLYDCPVEVEHGVTHLTLPILGQD